MYLLGDIHQDPAMLSDFAELQQETICVGDLGFDYNFFNFSRNPLMFIEGNHDYYLDFWTGQDNDAAYTIIRPGLMRIGRGHIMGKTLLIGGADSIDRHLRIEGRDWFREERITYDQISAILANPELKHVTQVVSHTCPSFVTKQLLEMRALAFGWTSRDFKPSPSEDLLEALFEALKPLKWYFGHHHFNFCRTIQGCEFRCIAPGKLFDIGNL